MSNLGNLDPGARVVLFPLWIDVLPGDEGERVNNHFVSSWGKPVAIKIGHVFDFVDVPNKVVNDCWTQLNRTDCGTNSTRSSNENERSVSIVCKWTTTPVSGCHVDLSNSGMLTLAQRIHLHQSVPAAAAESLNTNTLSWEHKNVVKWMTRNSEDDTAAVK